MRRAGGDDSGSRRWNRAACVALRVDQARPVSTWRARVNRYVSPGPVYRHTRRAVRPCVVFINESAMGKGDADGGGAR